jgi:hypothetical protein
MWTRYRPLRHHGPPWIAWWGLLVAFLCFWQSISTPAQAKDITAFYTTLDAIISKGPPFLGEGVNKRNTSQTSDPIGCSESFKINSASISARLERQTYLLVLKDHCPYPDLDSKISTLLAQLDGRVEKQFFVVKALAISFPSALPKCELYQIPCIRYIEENSKVFAKQAPFRNTTNVSPDMESSPTDKSRKSTPISEHFDDPDARSGDLEPAASKTPSESQDRTRSEPEPRRPSKTTTWSATPPTSTPMKRSPKGTKETPSPVPSKDLPNLSLWDRLQEAIGHTRGVNYTLPQTNSTAEKHESLLDVEGAPKEMNLWGLDFMDGVTNSHYSYDYTGKGVHVYIVDSGLEPGHPYVFPFS